MKESLIASVIPFTLLAWWLMPSRVKLFLLAATNIFMEMLSDAIVLFNGLVAVTIEIIFWIGKLTTAALLAGSLAIFLNELLGALNFSKMLSGAEYDALLKLCGQPFTPALVAFIVAATVALVHIKKYKIDMQESDAKRLERAQKLHDAKEAELKASREAQLAMTKGIVRDK